MHHAKSFGMTYDGEEPFFYLFIYYWSSVSHKRRSLVRHNLHSLLSNEVIVLYLSLICYEVKEREVCEIFPVYAKLVIHSSQWSISLFIRP